MARRNRKRIEINYPEIAVFALSKGSQMNERVHKGESYYYMLDMIETLMRKSNVVSGKVGISGYKEDIAAFFSQVMDLYMTKHIDIELVLDTNEFDPDYVPNKYR